MYGGGGGKSKGVELEQRIDTSSGGGRVELEVTEPRYRPSYALLSVPG
jgi:hypothetical protein